VRLRRSRPLHAHRLRHLAVMTSGTGRRRTRPRRPRPHDRRTDRTLLEGRRREACGGSDAARSVRYNFHRRAGSSYPAPGRTCGFPVPRPARQPDSTGSAPINTHFPDCYPGPPDKIDYQALLSLYSKSERLERPDWSESFEKIAEMYEAGSNTPNSDAEFADWALEDVPVTEAELKKLEQMRAGLVEIAHDVEEGHLLKSEATAAVKELKTKIAQIEWRLLRHPLPTPAINPDTKELTQDNTAANPSTESALLQVDSESSARGDQTPKFVEDSPAPDAHRDLLALQNAAIALIRPLSGNVARIAKEIGVKRSNLYSWSRFRTELDLFNAAGERHRRGRKG